MLELSEVQSILENDDHLRIILAGGLNPENVADVIRQLGRNGHKVACVDVSSGVESNGLQDLAKINAFVKAAKSLRA